MLGDINDYNNVVLTKADHELYDEKRRAFTEQFKSDLLSKTFLFLGVSFDDPYFNYILSRIPMLLAGEKRVHYCVMKKPDSAKLGRTAKSEYDAYKRFMLCVKDLRRYSIETLLVEDYAEVTEILCELNRRQYFKNISISGNVPQGARSEDQSRIESLAYGIGREVIKRGYHLFSSTESRIDTNALLGAVEEAYRSDGLSALQRIHLPTTAPRQRTARIEEAAITAQPRQLGMMNSGFVIFLGGDLTTTGGQSIPGAQTGQPSILEDYEIAKLMGIYPLPVGFTGSAAKQIWGEVNKSLRKFYVIQRVANHFAVLKDTKRSNAEIIEAIFTIIENTISSV
jgi:hypothetical protein